MAYSTKETLQSWAGYTDGVEETLLDDLLAKAKAIIDNHTGRVFDVSAATDQEFSRLNIPTEKRFHGNTLYFYEDLAAEAESITDSPTVIYLPEDGPPYYGCYLVDGSWAYPTVTVNGYWGYSKSGAVPADIEMACLMLAKWLYDSKDQTNTSTAVITPEGRVLLPKGLPSDILKILAPYKKAVLV